MDQEQYLKLEAALVHDHDIMRFLYDGLVLVVVKKLSKV